MISLYEKISQDCSKNITLTYSTSFSLGIKLLSKNLQTHIYNLYGFVRLADEIVDSFQGFPQKKLLEDFKKETFRSIDEKISSNPVLHSFQHTVNLFEIDPQLIHRFFHSMEMDLEPIAYTSQLHKEYVVGSAEVVGLMCLQVFVNGDTQKYKALEEYAKALGSVFQKVNFLRDLNYDYSELNRSYFPSLTVNDLNEENLNPIFDEIDGEFEYALEGIKQLPNSCKFGVFLAYKYYFKLFNKIKRTEKSKIAQKRIRIANGAKMVILLKTMIRHQLNWY